MGCARAVSAPAGWRWTEGGWLEREADGRRLHADLWTDGVGDAPMTALRPSALDLERLASQVDKLWPVAAQDAARWERQQRDELRRKIADAERAVAATEAGAEGARRRLWLLRADLAALGEGT